MNMQQDDRTNARRHIIILLMVTIALSAASFIRNDTWSDSAVLWQDAMIKSPARAQPAYKLGMVYVGKGDYQKAYELMAKARALDPAYFSRVLSPAERYRTTGDLATAIREYQRLIEANPEDPLLRLSLGTLYRIAGMPGRAEQEFFAALQLDTGSEAARAALDELYAARTRR